VNVLSKHLRESMVSIEVFYGLVGELDLRQILDSQRGESQRDDFDLWIH
jgi:hypothetical protein